MSGGINKDILQDVAKSDTGSLPSSDATSLSLLPINIFQYIRDYLNNHSISSDTSDKPSWSVFVQTERPRHDAGKHNASKHLSFNINEAIDIQRRLFFVTPDLHIAYSIDVSFDGFDDVTSWLATNSFQSNPTVFVSLGRKKIHWYPEGTENEKLMQEYEVNSIDTIDELGIDGALADFHHQSLLTPNCLHGKFSMWSNASKYYPCKNLERAIQELLKISLYSRFHGSVVIAEMPSPVGRYDLMITQYATANTFVPCAVLELKAFRTFGYSKEETPSKYSKSVHQAAAIEGLDQAYEYKKEWKAKLGFLCCYDARQDASIDIMKPIQADADDKSINLRHYILYNSAKSCRTAQNKS